jgi:hypothetical protein
MHTYAWKCIQWIGKVISDHGIMEVLFFLVQSERGALPRFLSVEWCYFPWITREWSRRRATNLILILVSGNERDNDWSAGFAFIIIFNMSLRNCWNEVITSARMRSLLQATDTYGLSPAVRRHVLALWECRLFRVRRFSLIGSSLQHKQHMFISNMFKHPHLVPLVEFLPSPQNSAKAISKYVSA